MVLHVRNRDGVDLVLKAAAPGAETTEVAVLRHAGEPGVFPSLVAEPEPGIYLMDGIWPSLLSPMPAVGARACCAR